MIINNEVAKKVANHLLQIKAIKLSPANPFTWASGIKSPIYCDNRKILSFPDTRIDITTYFAEAVKQIYPNVEVIAGVATGAIALGVMVADLLNLPFVYIRPEAKKHGLTNRIEGYLEEDKNVVVIEDLISTGGSSLSAVDALRQANVNVLGLLAVFTYGFQKSIDNFAQANCQFHTLSNYETMIEIALASEYISEKDIDLLKKWKENPNAWL